MENIWSMLRHAAADSRIKAVVFEPQGATVGWAKMQEIRADLEQFRKSGKPLVAYLKAPNMRDYYMASACSKIYMSPVDELDLKGIGLELMYYKNTLDKLGVHVDVEHVGKYKDYGDQFTRTSMSPETNEVMTSLIDDLFGDLVDTIAKGRGKSPRSIRAVIDDGPFLAKQAKANGPGGRTPLRGRGVRRTQNDSAPDGVEKDHRAGICERAGRAPARAEAIGSRSWSAKAPSLAAIRESRVSRPTTGSNRKRSTRCSTASRTTTASKA